MHADDRSLASRPAESRGVRIVCNRDESRLRPAARPPELRRFGQHQALMPIDPISDGTWIGVSDAPLAAVLMNVYIAQAEPEHDHRAAHASAGQPRHDHSARAGGRRV